MLAAAGRGPNLFHYIFSGTLGKKTFLDTIKKLNSFPAYEFYEAYNSESTLAYYSDKNRSSCWLKRHASDELADRLVVEISDFKYPVFRYANWVGYCIIGDTEDLATKARYILIGAGEWRE